MKKIILIITLGISLNEVNAQAKNNSVINYLNISQVEEVNIPMKELNISKEKPKSLIERKEKEFYGVIGYLFLCAISVAYHNYKDKRKLKTKQS